MLCLGLGCATSVGSLYVVTVLGGRVGGVVSGGVGW